jgi:hypothetical protein
MRVPRVTIAGMMAAVAVVAFDCFLLVMTDGAGVLLTGLALNVGLVLGWRGRGTRRRFWAGFVATALAVLLGYAICFSFEVAALTTYQWPLFVFNQLIMAHLPPTAEDWVMGLLADPMRQFIFILILFEVSCGLPMLLLAAIGGALAAWIGSRRAPRSGAAEVAGPIVLGPA